MEDQSCFHKGMDIYTFMDLAVVYELKGNTEVVRDWRVTSNVDEQTFISKYSDYEKIMMLEVIFIIP